MIQKLPIMQLYWSYMFSTKLKQSIKQPTEDL